ncbi:13S condensin subunit [Nosema bombycis CQ1]|uniref:13S condensin subunit n=1 Tax=Nosema bombycis (strain CQ1 / CVCC 102059) TaxID=578461 RepID=R0M5I0_NOSB1|nr:13S condensin subunit [Nosema bombycis CQ1]|eukprot:EOB13259.1 13S condensin subunit [Nosema bombycis CQ1]
MKLRNKLIKKIGERVLDKTILVRKRALTICSYLLMNHPFKSEGSLKRRGGSDGREVGGSSKVGNGEVDKGDKGNLPNPNLDTPINPTPNLHSDYFKDLNDFHDVFMQILNKVTIYLNSQISGDLQVFIEFIKLCLYYEIEGSREAFEMIFDFVLEGEEDSLSTCFSDIIVRLKMRKISPYSFLKQFIYSNSPSFNQILKVLYKKRIIDNDFYFNVVDLFLKGIDLLECSYLLRNIPKQIEEDLFYNLLKYTTGVLFSVQDSESLSEALKVYCNVLKIRVKRTGGNVKGNNSSKVEGDSKVDKDTGGNEPNLDQPNITNLNSTITTLIIKNLAKMVFFDYQTVQVSIQSLYFLSKNPEESVSQLLNTLSLKNVNSLKLIYSVGCIGVLHLEYLEKLENLAKKKKTKMDTIIPEDIKERRRSINASRLSINSNIEMSILNEMSIGESNCNGDYSEIMVNKRKKRNTINNTINNNNNFNFDQDLSDISDFFFFIKEKDLLYNKDALLYGYSKDIPKYCREGNDKIQEVSYLTLFKLMCLSSEYFLEHKDLLKSSFKHPNPKIRANSVIAMGDFLLYYNSITEDLSQLLFMNLNDKDLIVKRNTLLIIVEGYTTPWVIPPPCSS